MISRRAARLCSLACCGLTSIAPGAGLARVFLLSDARQHPSFFLNIGKRIEHCRAWLVMGKAIFHVAHYRFPLGRGHGADIKGFAP